jgi:hypothetical protein
VAGTAGWIPARAALGRNDAKLMLPSLCHSGGRTFTSVNCKLARETRLSLESGRAWPAQWAGFRLALCPPGITDEGSVQSNSTRFAD